MQKVQEVQEGSAPPPFLHFLHFLQATLIGDKGAGDE
jgi:hypothetical protein